MAAGSSDIAGEIGALPEAVAEVPAVAHPGSDRARHLAEMVVVMMAGMMVLSAPVAAIARALGYPDLGTTMPAAATLVMAAEMTVPMALWMAFRGHHRRGVIEMSAVMAVPAIVLVAAGTAGLMTPLGSESAYHPAMLVAMVAYVLLRRDATAGMG